MEGDRKERSMVPPEVMRIQILDGLTIQHSPLVHVNGSDACPCGSQKGKSQKSHLHSEEQTDVMSRIPSENGFMMQESMFPVLELYLCRHVVKVHPSK